MLVEMRAYMLAHEKRTHRAEIITAIQSTDFQASLQGRINALLLSPNLTAYVAGITARLMELIVQRPAAFNVDRAMIENHDTGGMLASVVSKLVNCVRGNIKQKLTTSLGCDASGRTKRLAPQNVTALCESLVSKEVFITRAALVEFNKLDYKTTTSVPASNSTSTTPKGQPPATVPQIPKADPGSGEQPDAEEGAAGPTNAQAAAGNTGEDVTADDDEAAADSMEEYRSNQYWKYVDDQLATMREDIEKAFPKDDAAQVKAWDQGVNDILQRDLKTYRPVGRKGKASKLPPVDTAPTVPWQTFIEGGTVF
ncbi:hypothetical protein BV20DRAFT_1055280 [Pilatotrama ljubarskyi]|nr:hypothetical protein BV20DRAFT_1055280 [Pilatotrama ljubarskyi]